MSGAGVRAIAYETGEIAALCRFLAQALAADSDTAAIGEAVEGICRAARRVSDNALDLANLIEHRS